MRYYLILLDFDIHQFRSMKAILLMT